MKFEESGLQFEFDDESCYRIENSAAAIEVGEGIKKAEFVCLQDKNIWVLEAKTTMPRESTDKDRYEEWWQEIYEKLSNSIQLTVLGLAGRHGAIGAELPEKLKSVNWSELNIQLVLVIPDVPITFLQPLTDKLRQMFSVLFLKLWKIKASEIMVINRDLARKKSLCQ